MDDESRTSPTFSSGRRFGIGFNVTVSVLALLALVAMSNYLASRHFERFHLTENEQHQISPMTQRVLENLTNEVKIIYFYHRASPIYSPPVAALLDEYRFASPLVTVEKVDYIRDHGRAQEIKNHYKIATLSEDDNNFILFDSQGRVKVVKERELSDYEQTNFDLSKAMQGEPLEVIRKRTNFKGEMLFTSAILNVTQPQQAKVFFLQDHGEYNVSDEVREMGYGKFAAVLREKNIAVEAGNLIGGKQIPEGCDLIVIPGPTVPYKQDELEKIDRYLNEGGRLFLLFDFRSMTNKIGLEKIMARWGVEVGHDLVVDQDQSPTRSAQDLVSTNFANHPIVRPLFGSYLHLVRPRSVSKLRGNPTGADSAEAVELAFTSDNAMALTEVRRGTINPENVRRGTIPLMVAVEKGTIEGVNVAKDATRIVVTGDALFLNNQMISTLPNRDFASSAVDWLMDRTQLYGGLGPRPVREYKLALTATQLHSLQWILLVAMPGSVLLVGLLVWFRRRH